MIAAAKPRIKPSRVVFKRAPGDLYRVVAVPRNGTGPVRTLLALTEIPWSLDVASDERLYVDQVQRPLDVLRFPVSGGVPERLAGSATGKPYVIQFSDGRTLLPTLLSGRNRLLVARPGKDPVPFVDTEEETSAPMTLVGEREVAFLAGSGADRTIAIASTADGRIVRRLPGARGAPVWSLASSPDGKTLYYAASGNIWSIPAAGGEPRRLAAGDGVAAGSDGQHLIVQRKEKTGSVLLRLPLSGGPESPIPFLGKLRPTIDGITPNSVLKDGRIVLAVASTDSWFYGAAVLDSKTGKVEKVPVPYAGDIFLPGWTSDGRILAPGQQMRGALWRFQKDNKQ